jgi:signal-transduction protein with cAMP-binding, CBS, and nucleotidyltransferase domain
MKHNYATLKLKATDCLKKLLSEFVDVDSKDIEQIASLCEIDFYDKNDIIIKEREVSTNLYFICKGLIRIYFFKNEKLVIDRFEKEGGFFGGNYNHLTAYPGIRTFEALEDLVLLKMKQSDFEILCKNNHRIETLHRKILESIHYAYIDRFFAQKSSSAEERYLDFINNNQEIAARISLKNLASYLDMTSETLSRIRAKYDLNTKT